MDLTGGCYFPPNPGEDPLPRLLLLRPLLLPFRGSVPPMLTLMRLNTPLVLSQGTQQQRSKQVHQPFKATQQWRWIFSSKQSIWKNPPLLLIGWFSCRPWLAGNLEWHEYWRPRPNAFLAQELSTEAGLFQIRKTFVSVWRFPVLP